MKPFAPVRADSAEVGLTAGAAPAAGTALFADEQRLWARAGEEEAALDRSSFAVSLPGEEAYLDDIVARLHPGDLMPGTPFRVSILADSSLNAFAMPNGRIFVHTGLLARLENEAQLATVLGHELSHATYRHALRGFRDLKNKSAFFVTMSVGTGGVGALMGAIGLAASVTGYSRDLEREADAAGFSRLMAAGYDPRESVPVFGILLAEAERRKEKEPYFFGSHPRLSERIASFTSLVNALPPDRRRGELGEAAYLAHLPDVLRLNAEAALRVNDVDCARFSVKRGLGLAPRDRRMRLLEVEVLRRSEAAGDAALALEKVRALATDEPDLAEAQRTLGVLLMRGGQHVPATAAFSRYLALAPDAPDRGYVEEFIRQCNSAPSASPAP